MHKFRYYILFVGLLISNSLSAQITAKTIVKKYFRAIGGYERAIQVDSYFSVSSALINNRNVTIHNKQKRPNLKSVTMFSENKLVSRNVFDGDNGFVLVNGRKKKYDADKRQKLREESTVFPEFQYLKSGTYLGIEKVKGENCYVVGFQNTKVFYSVRTGLKVKGIAYRDFKGNKFKQETFFMEYKPIKGILFPIAYMVRVKGREVMYNINSISLNREVSIEDFK